MKISEMLRQAGPIYNISPGGLTKLNKTSMHLQPGAFYYLGASSSPKNILITKVTDDWLYYRDSRSDFQKEFKIDRPVGDDLIERGSKTRLKLHEGWPKEMGPQPKWATDEIKNLKILLSGKPVKPVNIPAFIKGQERIEVKVVPVEGADFSEFGNDPWRLAEQYGAVSGKPASNTSSKMEYYLIETRKEVLPSLKDEKLFKIISVKDI